ncbi:MAG TPA: GGDEF domain-containing protein [Allosphingosinicella sp.]|jgi:diguanylate cyclase (GGDEF)-like protein
MGARLQSGWWRDARAAARRGRAMLPALKIEAAIFALLALTFLAIGLKDPLLKRSLVLTPTSGNYTTYWYGDQAMGGASEARADPNRPLAWECELRGDYDYPYCGYELLFDGQRREKGIDFRKFRTITLDLSYQGPAEALRLHLKNQDPRYSKPSAGEADKFNKVEFLHKGKDGRIRIDLDEFSVAEWWLVNNKIPPELAQPQFDNIISLELQTGTGSQPGIHRFRINAIAMEGSVLTSEQFYLAILGVWVAAIGLFLAYRIVNLKKDVEARRKLHAAAQLQAEEAERAARIDPLTRLLNRAGIAEGYARMAEQGAGPVCAILIDIDHFKALNDQFGHAYGDEVIASFAGLLKRNSRAGDIVGRWGGEEFLLLCAGLDAGRAVEYANRLRNRIEHFHFGERETVTASFGLHLAEDAALGDLVREADVALYTAKARGRNRAVLFWEGLRKAA